MTIAHTKLPGLDAPKVLAIVEPVLAAHRVDGVELMWRGDKDGKVLVLSIEKPGTQRTGDGITIELCTDIARALSEAFDETEVIGGRYRLEVGSPGVERRLYLADDYRRFAGQEVKVTLIEPIDVEGFLGQKTIRGTLFGLDEGGRVVLETDHGHITLSFEQITIARLVFNWGQPKRKTGRPKRPPGAGARRANSKRSS
jgi:ribosome maturation factor RimP